jgi:hypothetical protein
MEQGEATCGGRWRSSPQSRPILLLAGKAQLQLGRPMEARAFVQRADALGPDARTLALAVRAEDAAGDAVPRRVIASASTRNSRTTSRRVRGPGSNDQR